MIDVKIIVNNLMLTIWMLEDSISSDYTNNLKAHKKSHLPYI